MNMDIEHMSRLYPFKILMNVEQSKFLNISQEEGVKILLTWDSLLILVFNISFVRQKVAFLFRNVSVRSLYLWLMSILQTLNFHYFRYLKAVNDYSKKSDRPITFKRQEVRHSRFRGHKYLVEVGGRKKTILYISYSFIFIFIFTVFCFSFHLHHVSFQFLDLIDRLSASTTFNVLFQQLVFHFEQFPMAVWASYVLDGYREVSTS